MFCIFNTHLKEYCEEKRTVLNNLTVLLAIKRNARKILAQTVPSSSIFNFNWFTARASSF